MASNTLFWDKHESKHKPLKACSLDHIEEMVSEIEREIAMRTWEELPPFESTMDERQAIIEWRIIFMKPAWQKIARFLHRHGVRI